LTISETLDLRQAPRQYLAPARKSRTTSYNLFSIGVNRSPAHLTQLGIAREDANAPRAKWHTGLDKSPHQVQSSSARLRIERRDFTGHAGRERGISIPRTSLAAFNWVLPGLQWVACTLRR